MNIYGISNTKPNFRAQAKIKFSDEFFDCLKNEGVNGSQKIIDTVNLLKEVSPVIGKDKDVLTLSSSSKNCLQLNYNEREIGTIGIVLQPKENLALLIMKLTRGDLNLDDILPKTEKSWGLFIPTEDNPNIFIRTLYDNVAKKYIKTEKTTSEDKIKEVIALQTIA